tara:strand:+ start:361 stop:768 length:408 start_codon:yes stop_codon:yes gene_type:complete
MSLPTWDEIRNADTKSEQLELMQKIEQAGHGDSKQREYLNLRLNYDRTDYHIFKRWSYWEKKGVTCMGYAYEYDTVPERELKNKLMKTIEDWSIQDLESLLGMVEGDMIQDIIHQRALVIGDELADAVMLGEWRR